MVADPADIVLNAFRHHRGSHPYRWNAPGLGLLVLNAFRHHRGSHPYAALRCRVGHSTCSTPFGITEVLTPFGRAPQPRRLACAQRLSASQRFSLSLLLHPGLHLLVLNAFRHHRGSHCALMRAARPAAACAQRLSASQRFSHSDGPLRVVVPIVLNAFRHHRGSHSGSPREPSRRPSAVCSTPFGITEVLTAGRVLAHRVAPGCSTPFGITEVLTGTAVELTSIGLGVLNAFRHHRGSHAVRFARNRRASACSTPFGITEVLTPVAAAEHRLSENAVLNAFRHHRGSHSWPGASVSTHHVLNAFRHHRGSHRSRLDISGGRLSGVVFMDLILCGKDPVPMSSRG